MTRHRWLMLSRPHHRLHRLPQHRLWITTGEYTFEEVLAKRKDFPICPLARVQSEDYDALRELVLAAQGDL